MADSLSQMKALLIILFIRIKVSKNSNGLIQLCVYCVCVIIFLFSVSTLKRQKKSNFVCRNKLADPAMVYIQDPEKQARATNACGRGGPTQRGYRCHPDQAGNVNWLGPYQAMILNKRSLVNGPRKSKVIGETKKGFATSAGIASRHILPWRHLL